MSNEQIDIISQEEEEGLNLKKYWQALKRRKKIVFLTTSIVVSIFGIQTIKDKIYNPLYRGEVTLMISDPFSGGLGEGLGGKIDDMTNRSTMFESLARNNRSSDVPTLMAFMRSPFLLAPIAEKFGLSSKALANRIEIRSGDPNYRGGKRAKGILRITLMGNDPVKDQILLEALTQGYLEASLNVRLERLKEGMIFLDKQAPDLERQARAQEENLIAFRKKFKNLDPTKDANYSIDNIKKNELELNSHKAKLKRLTQLKDSISKGELLVSSFFEQMETEATFMGSSNELNFNDPEQQIIKQLATLEEKLSKARLRYTPNSVVIKNIENRLMELKPIRRKIQLKVLDQSMDFIKVKIKFLEENISNYEKEFKDQPLLIEQYRNLENANRLAKKNVLALNATKEKFQLEMAQKNIAWTVISPPYFNPIPVAPSLKKELTNGLMLGIFLGVVLALLRDKFDHVYHTSSEVNEEIRLPLLAHIPHVDFFTGVREDKRFLLKELDETTYEGSSPDELTDKRYQRFFYQEAFRNLYTSIRFLNSDKPLKTIAITSSIPAEGKSLVTVLLAKTISEMGLKVLQIDADMRKPQLHTRLGLNNITGLSNLLIEKEIKPAQVIQSLPGYTNWKVISAGTIPPEPTRLLSSNRMQEMILEFSRNDDFDIILIDTPPVLGLSDAALVSSYCDGMFLLVSLSNVDRDIPIQACNKINESKGNLLGLITNSIKKNLEPNDQYEGKLEEIYNNYADDEENIQDNTEENELLKHPTLVKLKEIYLKGKDKIMLIWNWIDN